MSSNGTSSLSENAVTSPAGEAAGKSGVDDVNAKGKYLLIMVPDFAYDPVPPPLEEPEEAEDPAAEAEADALDRVISDTESCCDDQFEETLAPDGDDGPRIEREEQIAAEAEAPKGKGQTPASDKPSDKKHRLMTSFIRLGVFHEEWRKQPGGELAALALEVPTGQGGHLNAKYGGEVDVGVDAAKISGAAPFLDDLRYRDSADGTVPLERRLEESKHLFDRGGWWDHSDGNRVSTTYGDKVEVIRGNYKMVVMGRQDNPDFGGGWDHSGGNIQDLGPNMMPGASVRVEYRKDKHTGQWHLENQTNNFIQTSDFAGDFFEHWYGNKKYATIGSEKPRKYSKELEKPFGNPHLLEKTWACKIESYTGSAAWRIPKIIDHTHARRIEELVDVTGDIKSTTRAGAINEETTVAAGIRSETKAGSITEITSAGAITSITNAGPLTEITTAGVVTSVTTALGIIDVTTAAVGAEIETIGAKLEVTIGHRKEIEIPDDNKITVQMLENGVNRVTTTVSNVRTAVTHTFTGAVASIQAAIVRLGI